MAIPDELAVIAEELPKHDSTLPKATITFKKLEEADILYLYSPWTLDPKWRSSESGLRVLVLPSHIFTDGAFSQNVLDSIMHFAKQIGSLKTIYLSDRELSKLDAGTIYRKSYPGIRNWPGTANEPELLHPGLPEKFYPSYGAYWKAIKKYNAE